MPGSIRVACAPNGGEALDGRFGSARRFLIYQVSAETVRLIDARPTDDSGAEDKNAIHAGLIRGCQLLYLASTRGPSAAKVVKADIHPVKDDVGGSARDRMAALRRILADRPPPDAVRGSRPRRALTGQEPSLSWNWCVAAMEREAAGEPAEKALALTS